MRCTSVDNMMCVSRFVYLSFVNLLKGRDRIEASRIERMAFPDAAHCERTAADHTVDFYRIQRVVGATRVKPALVADEWAQGNLIATNDELQRAARSIA